MIVTRPARDGDTGEINLVDFRCDVHGFEPGLLIPVVMADVAHGGDFA